MEDGCGDFDGGGGGGEAGLYDGSSPIPGYLHGDERFTVVWPRRLGWFFATFLVLAGVAAYTILGAYFHGLRTNDTAEWIVTSIFASGLGFSGTLALLGGFRGYFGKESPRLDRVIFKHPPRLLAVALCITVAMLGVLVWLVAL